MAGAPGCWAPSPGHCGGRRRLTGRAIRRIGRAAPRRSWRRLMGGCDMPSAGRVRVVAPTERRNSATVHLDTLDTMGVLQLVNAEDARVPRAVAAALPHLARAVDLAVASLRSGGRVHYFGAG